MRPAAPSACVWNCPIPATSCPPGCAAGSRSAARHRQRRHRPPTKAEEYRRIKPRVSLLSIPPLLLLPGTALADTLPQALEAAYKSNPTLTAQHDTDRPADETVPNAPAPHS